MAEATENIEGAPAIVILKREHERIRKEKYGNVVEGPAGLKMPEIVARAIDEAKKTAPREVDIPYKRLAATPGEFSLDKNERSDISYITTDAIDRDRECVLPGGMDNRDYNGVVTFAHMYDALPMGRNLWIKSKNNGLIGKTKYAAKPKDWDSDWFADAVLSLMQEDPPTCTGKSIGFIPTEYRSPTSDEVRARPELAECRAIIPKWKLMEYAVAPVPANPEAEMLQVSKSLSDEDTELYQLALKSISPIIVAAKEQAKAIEPKIATAFIRPETIAKAAMIKVEQRKKELENQLGKDANRLIVDRIHAMLGTP